MPEIREKEHNWGRTNNHINHTKSKSLHGDSNYNYRKTSHVNSQIPTLTKSTNPGRTTTACTIFPPKP